MAAKQSRKRVASVREYVASKPKESRASLEAVRRAILKALPHAQEGLAYQIPAYTLNGVGVLYFAGWKAHYSLYPASDALVEAFAKDLAPYERCKGTLKFPLSEPVPVRLQQLAQLPAALVGGFRARVAHGDDRATRDDRIGGFEVLLVRHVDAAGGRPIYDFGSGSCTCSTVSLPSCSFTISALRPGASNTSARRGLPRDIDRSSFSSPVPA